MTWFGSELCIAFRWQVFNCTPPFSRRSPKGNLYSVSCPRNQCQNDFSLRFPLLSTPAKRNCHYQKLKLSLYVSVTFQMVSICCGTLLAAIIASVYSQAVRPAVSDRQSTSQQLLMPIVEQPTAGFVMARTFAWFVTISARVLMIAVLIKVSS